MTKRKQISLLRYPELRTIYLEHLAKHGNRAMAADYIRVSSASVDEFRLKYPWFEAQCDESMAHHRGLIEATVRKRAIDGVLEPKFGKTGVIGHVRRYSDQLLLAYARRWIPEYRTEENKMVVTGEVTHRHAVDAKVLTPEKRAALRLLLGAGDAPEPDMKTIEHKIVDVGNNGASPNGTNGHHHTNGSNGYNNVDDGDQ